MSKEAMETENNMEKINILGKYSDDLLTNPDFYLSLEGIKVLYIDNNIFSYITNCFSYVDNSQFLEKRKRSVELLIFCKKNDILVEPVYAVQEKLKFDYSEENIEKAFGYFRQFLTVYSLPNEFLYDCFVKGNKQKLDLPLVEDDYTFFKESVSKYEMLKEWKSMYLLVLKIIIENLSSKSNEEKLKNIFDFMYYNYEIRTAVVIYSFYFFSDKQLICKMNKYKQSKSFEENKENINNMTWDLYFMTMAYKNLSEKNKNSFFATEDKCLNGLMQLLMCFAAIDEMPEEIRNEKIQEVIYKIAVTRNIADYYFDLCCNPNRSTDKNRFYLKYVNEEFTQKRDELICELEKKLKTFYLQKNMFV